MCPESVFRSVRFDADPTVDVEGEPTSVSKARMSAAA